MDLSAHSPHHCCATDRQAAEVVFLTLAVFVLREEVQGDNTMLVWDISLNTFFQPEEKKSS